MKPNLHPEQAKALYREIANDAGPARSRAPGIGLGPVEDGVPLYDENLWLAIVGGLAIIFGVVAIAGVRALV